MKKLLIIWLLSSGLILGGCVQQENTQPEKTPVAQTQKQEATKTGSEETSSWNTKQALSGSLENNSNNSSTCNLVWHDQDLSIDFFKEITGPIDCNSFEVYNYTTKIFEKTRNIEQTPTNWSYSRDKNGYYSYFAYYGGEGGRGTFDYIRVTSDANATIKNVWDLFYLKDSKNIYYKWRVLNDADENTLKLINEGQKHPYIKLFSDKNYVWFEWDLIDKANPATFHIVSFNEDESAGTNNVISADKSLCFNMLSTGQNQVVSRFQRVNDYSIPGCDPKGLKDLWKWFLTDWKSIFASGDYGQYEKLSVNNPQDFKVPENDAIAQCYRYGRWYNYYNGPTLSGSINCESAEYFDTTDKKFKPISFSTALPRGYLKDNSGLYYISTEKSCWGAACTFTRISTETWVTVNSIWNTFYAKDSKNLFYREATLTWAIEKSLHVVTESGSYYTIFADTKHVWFDWWLLQEADAKTFKIVRPKDVDNLYILAIDKNHCFHLLWYGWDSGIINWCSPSYLKDLGKDYSTDWKNVFNQTTKVDGADPKTFKVPE